MTERKRWRKLPEEQKREFVRFQWRYRKLRLIPVFQFLSFRRGPNRLSVVSAMCPLYCYK